MFATVKSIYLSSFSLTLEYFPSEVCVTPPCINNVSIININSYTWNNNARDKLLFMAMIMYGHKQLLNVLWNTTVYRMVIVQAVTLAVTALFQHLPGATVTDTVNISFQPSRQSVQSVNGVIFQE